MMGRRLIRHESGKKNDPVGAKCLRRTAACSEAETGSEWKTGKGVRSLLKAVLAYVRFHGLSYTLHHGAEKIGERVFRTYDRVYRSILAPGAEVCAKQTPLGGSGLVSFLIPLYRTQPSFLRALLESLLAQTEPNWEACLYDGGLSPEAEELLSSYARQDTRFRVRKAEKNEGIAGNTNRALEMARGEWTVLCDHDDLLPADALHRLWRTILETGADVVYTDEDKVTEDGRVYTDPHFKPDFGPDSLRSANYVCHLLAVRRELMLKVGGERVGFDGSQDHDLMLRLAEKTDRIAHAHGVCYHWRTVGASASHSNRMKCMEASCRAVKEHLNRIGFPGTAEPDQGVIRLTYEIRKPLSVQVLLFGGTEAQAETIRKTCAWKPTTVRIVTGENRYAAWNQAAAESAADVLLFLDASVSGMQPDTVREMLMYAQRQDVGAVTTALTDRRGRVTHAGFAYGPDFPGFAACRHAGLKLNAGGWHILTRQAHNVGAVSSACIMVRRLAFLPFDPAFTGGLGAVDWCLRMHKAGFVHVYTPHGHMVCEDRELVLLRRTEKHAEDERSILKKWPDVVDSCYSPYLSTKANFRLDPERAGRFREKYG